MSYDAWLEAPYVLQAEEDALHEEFQASTVYEVAYAVWRIEELDREGLAADLSTDDYEGSAQYADDFEAWRSGPS